MPGWFDEVEKSHGFQYEFLRNIALVEFYECVSAHND